MFKRGLLVALLITISSLHLFADDVALKKTIDAKILKAVAYSEEISQVWNTLLQEGVVEMSGKDADVRPLFVTLQGMLEHVLASELQKEVTTLKGVIHTPMPATPLCTTGTLRARILRGYLFKGGDLYIVYPKDGLYQRPEEQQKIYREALMDFPAHLFDSPLNCESIPTELIGATYFFQDRSGNTFVFSIKMTQANDSKDMGHFGLWFDSIDAPAIQARVQAVSSYLEQNGSHVLKNGTKVFSFQNETR